MNICEKQPETIIIFMQLDNVFCYNMLAIREQHYQLIDNTAKAKLGEKVKKALCPVRLIHLLLYII